VPRHVARLVTRFVAPLVVDYSASRTLVVDYSASRRLIVDYFASSARPGALHVARLVAPLVVDYFASTAHPGASARRAVRHTARRAARGRLLRLA
jgi:hypothetical protein